MTENQIPAPTVQELFDLTGRTALLTGGSGHLGTAMASALAEAGASVVVSSRDRKRAEAAVAALPVAGEARHRGVEIDHKDETSIQSGFADAIEHNGGLDILVNNGHDGITDDLKTVSADGFDSQLANATGYFLLARRLRNHAVGRGKPASIILIGSMYGTVGSYPDAYDGICEASSVGYQALKGGIIQITRHLAVYWAKDRVRVNCLSPGPFPSPAAPQEMVERLCQKSPMGRMGLPHEIKAAVVYLAGDASSYMTGHNLAIDGGWTAW